MGNVVLSMVKMYCLIKCFPGIKPDGWERDQKFTVIVDSILLQGDLNYYKRLI